ncbi:MAG: hypothetical protein ACK4GN_11300 [Runella sp.]
MSSTAQSFFEVYKALPKKVQKEVKALIVSNERLIDQIEEGLKEVKQMKDGQRPKRSVKELLKELRNE